MFEGMVVVKFVQLRGSEDVVLTGHTCLTAALPQPIKQVIERSLPQLSQPMAGWFYVKM